ncbi:hypothetical protein QUF80_07880 [Desulfococcaceae bacterium HSG8]|nr:hypothetical protein [Desulfococcaceae bacterium HSG8]
MKAAICKNCTEFSGGNGKCLRKNGKISDATPFFPFVEKNNFCCGFSPGFMPKEEFEAQLVSKLRERLRHEEQPF